MRNVKAPAIVLAVLGIASLYAWAVIASTPAHPGTIGLNINALGTDWMVFYGADQWVLTGRLAHLFNGAQFTAYLNAAFAPWLSMPLSFRPWVYPPSYLLAVLPFGLLPFTASYAAFQLTGACLLAAALWFGADRPHMRGLVIATAVLGPAASIVAGMGQNALLFAALLVAGWRLVRYRPLLGGAVLGLVTLKPQFYMLVPIALLAAREWRAFAASLVAAAAFAGLSAAVFGIGLWRSWLDFSIGALAHPNGLWIEFGRLWGVSVYATLVSTGVSAGISNAAQVAAILLAAGLVGTAFRRRLPTDQKLALLLACTILAAPHSSLADLELASVAAGLWIAEAAQQDISLAEWTLALALWLIPLMNPPVLDPVGRFTPALLLLFASVIIVRARPIATMRHPDAFQGGAFE